MADTSLSRKLEAPPTACPATQVFEIVGPKWTMNIIHTLTTTPGPIRFRLLQRTVGSITPKELTKRLRELERAGLVSRTVFAEVPPRVEYALTNLGQTMFPALVGLHQWVAEHGSEVEANRRRFDELKSNLVQPGPPI